MLQKLRDQTQGTGFKILVIAIILVLTLFGFGATNLFLGADPEVASVGDFEITQSVLATETERERRRILAQMGPDFDPSSIDRLRLQEYVLQQLISRQVLYQTAADLGMRVAPTQVNDALVNNEAYQIDGRFNEQVYRQQVQALGFTPQTFVEEFTSALTAEQLTAGVESSVLLTDWELGELIRVITQRRDMAFLPLTVEQFSGQVTLEDTAVETRYAEEQSLYMTEQAADVAYLYLNAADLADDAAITVSEAEVLSLYEEDKATALADEQRDSAHILVQVNGERDAEAALALITDIEAQLVAGESFEKLAEMYSEDPGSAAAGGALGSVGRGIFDAAFEEALWALGAPGDVSGPVLSPFGYHLIRLNEVITPDYPDFDLQQEVLTQRVREAKAADLFVDRALELERAAYDERYALDNTAAALGLEVKRVARVARDNNGGDALLSLENVLDAVFSVDVLDGTNSDSIEIGDGEVMIVRVDAQYAPEPVPLETVAAAIREKLVQEQAKTLIAAAKAEGLARLQAGDSVAAVAESLGSDWQTHALITRGGSEEIPEEVRTRVFAMPRPPAQGRSVDAVDTANGAALVTVTRVIQGDINATTDTELAQVRRLSAERVGRFDLQGFFRAAEEALAVNRPLSQAPVFAE